LYDILDLTGMEEGTVEEQQPLRAERVVTYSTNVIEDQERERPISLMSAEEISKANLEQHIFSKTSPHEDPHVMAFSSFENMNDDSPLRSLSPDTMSMMTCIDTEARRSQINLAMNLSLIANVLLCAAKIWALVWSGSLSLVASLLDSGLDLISQILLYFSENSFRIFDDYFPVGKTRLTPLSILICSALMFMGAVEVMQSSIMALIKHENDIDFAWYICLILGIAISTKGALFFLCAFGPVKDDPSVETLAEDHRNDVLTNSGALFFGSIAYYHKSLWWFDPSGGILLSIYIAWSWVDIGWGTMNKLVGRKADAEQEQHVRHIIECFEQVEDETRVECDWLRCYYLGEHLFVEVEVVMDKDLTLKVTHDVSLSLQQAIEKLNFVERAFVHIDYQHRDVDEHKSYFDNYWDKAQKEKKHK